MHRLSAFPSPSRDFQCFVADGWPAPFWGWHEQGKEKEGLATRADPTDTAMITAQAAAPYRLSSPELEPKPPILLAEGVEAVCSSDLTPGLELESGADSFRAQGAQLHTEMILAKP